MKLELKKLKLYPALSEETQAYSADVYLDGKLIAHATNDGHGASDNFTPQAPFTYDDLLALEKRIAAEHPPLKSSITGEDLPYTLEMVCGDLIHRFQTEKRLARAMKSKIVIITGNDLREFSYRGIKTLTPEFYAKAKPQVLAKYPSATILNDMPLSDAVDAVIALPA